MKQRYIIMVVLIGLLIISSINLSYAQFAGGDGSETDPFLIETAVQLDAIRGSYGEYHYRQIADIDLSEYENWFPLPGHGVNSFTGSFDGNGYKILNLTINWSNYYIGLFCSIEGATLKRIALENVNVTGYQCVGGLSGGSYNSVIDSCYVVGNIEGRNIVGGLVGENWGGQINNSYAISVVTSNGYNSYNHGGLVGLNVGEGGEINNSYSKGSVHGVNFVGGLVGSNEGSPSPCLPEQSYINNSYSTADVMGTSKVGGLVGYNRFQGIINNSYAMGTVEGYYYVGGLVGHNSYDSEINNCYSIGLVIGNENVGGLIGSNDNGGIIEDSYWDIESSEQTTSAGGTGLTTLEMLQSNNFTSWDFDETWKILDFSGLPFIRKHYPVLQWQLGSSLAHNRVDNAHVHRYKERKYHWRSFPRLEVQDSHNDTIDLLYPLAGIIDGVESMTGFMEWTDGAWQIFDGPVAFKSVEGYKLRFIDLHEHFLYASGPRESRNTEITLYPNQENWIGYFLPNTQSVFAAFGSQVMDQLQSIKTDEWGMYRVDENTWIGYASQPNYTIRQFSYGKMYVVETRVEDPVTFRWLGDDIPEPPEPPIPPVKFFVYDEKPDYESFFIEDIEDDDDVLEVAVLAGDECVGASVFLGGYPLEILAYTDESHYGEEISFVILRDDKNRVPEKIRVPQVMNIENGEYSPKVIRPREQKFTIVRLSTDDHENDLVPSPEIILSQNYPNPVFIGSARRSILTKIPFYVSEAREVKLTIYNIKGQLVKDLYDGNVNAGKHLIAWDGLNDYNRKVGSGVYFYRLESGDTVITRKMLIIR